MEENVNPEPFPWETDKEVKHICSRCQKGEAEIECGYCQNCRDEVYGKEIKSNLKTWDANKDYIFKKMRDWAKEAKEEHERDLEFIKPLF